MKIISALVISLLLSVGFAQSAMAKSTTSIVKSAKQNPAQSEKVNLNQADAKEIAKVLKGIGPKKAQAIVEYRKQHGDFKAIEELASVKGIGVATIAKNHGKILLK